MRDRQTDRQTEGGETDRERDRQTRQTDRQTDRQTEGGETDREGGRGRDRQREGQTD